MKKFLKIFVGFVVFIVMLLILVPFFVNVDKFRPQIIQAAEPYINGKLEIGKLYLSLWSGIKVKADGIKITNSEKFKNETMFEVKDVYLDIPFSAIFAGKPTLTFVMNNPEISVVNTKAGMNVNDIVKMQPTAQAEKTAEAGKTPVAKPEQKANAEAVKQQPLPNLVVQAKVQVNINNSTVKYKDEVTGMKAEVSPLDIEVKDISLSDEIKTKITANLNVKPIPELSVKGIAVLEAKTRLLLEEGNKFAELKTTFNFDATQMAITYGTLFSKPENVVLKAKSLIDVTPSIFKLTDTEFQFHNLKTDIKAEVEYKTSQSVKASINAKPFDLKSWENLIPMLKQFALSGEASFNADVGGTIAAITYGAGLDLKGVSLKAAQLKTPVVIDMQAKAAKDLVKIQSFAMKAGSSDLRAEMTVENFAKPKIVATIDSKNLNIDEMIDLPKPVPAGTNSSADAKAANSPAQATDAKGATATAGAQVKKEKLDLSPYKKNPYFMGTNMNIKFALNKISAMNYVITNMSGKMIYDNAIFALKDFEMNLYKGKIGANFNVDLKPELPPFSGAFKLAELDMKTALEAQVPAYKNSASGKVNANLVASGKGIDAEDIMKSLEAKGSGVINDGVFHSIDAAGMIKKALSDIKALGNVKIPEIENGFKTMILDFDIKNEKFNIAKFEAKGFPNKGVDLLGKGYLDFKMNMDLYLEAMDTYKLIKIPDLINKKRGFVVIPFHVTGTALAPKPDYTMTVTELGKVVVENKTGALADKAKAQLVNKIQENKQVQKALENPQVKKAIENPKVQEVLKKSPLKGLFGK